MIQETAKENAAGVRLPFLAFSLDSYHVVVVRSNQPYFIVKLIVKMLTVINIQIPIKIPITMNFIFSIPCQNISFTHQGSSIFDFCFPLGVTSRIRGTWNFKGWLLVALVMCCNSAGFLHLFIPFWKNVGCFFGFFFFFFWWDESQCGPVPWHTLLQSPQH